MTSKTRCPGVVWRISIGPPDRLTMVRLVSMVSSPESSAIEPLDLRRDHDDVVRVAGLIGQGDGIPQRSARAGPRAVERIDDQERRRGDPSLQHLERRPPRPSSALEAGIPPPAEMRFPGPERVPR